MKLKTLVLSFIPFLITGVLWLNAIQTTSINLLEGLCHLAGGLSLTGFAIVFFLSAKTKFNDNHLKGLGRVYKSHKYFAFLSLSFVLVHSFLSELAGEGGETLFGSLGSLAQFMFIALTLITIFGKKIKYENWRLSHRLMFVAYIIGLAHAYLSSYFDLTSLTLLGIWTSLTAIIGLSTGIYSIFIYPRLGFRAQGKITNISHLSKRVIEITIELKKSFPIQSGQYVFLRIFQNGLENAPHPFSITFNKDKQIRLAIKASGDFTTQLIEQLKAGTKVAVSQAYGQMNFENGPSKQLWIAGGIGITPFMSYLTSGTFNKTIDLYYSFHGKEEAIYKDFLDNFQRKNKNFHVTFIDTSQNSRINIEKYPLNTVSAVYICGPKPMVDSLTKTINKINPAVEINKEGFQFR